MKKIGPINLNMRVDQMIGTDLILIKRKEKDHDQDHIVIIKILNKIKMLRKIIIIRYHQEKNLTTTKYFF